MEYYKSIRDNKTFFYAKNMRNGVITKLHFNNGKFICFEIFYEKLGGCQLGILLGSIETTDKEYKEALQTVFNELMEAHEPKIEAPEPTSKDEHIQYLQNELKESERKRFELHDNFSDLEIEKNFISEKLEKVSNSTLKVFTKLETFFELYERSETKAFDINLVSSFARIIQNEKEAIESLINTTDSDDLPF